MGCASSTEAKAEQKAEARSPPAEKKEGATKREDKDDAKAAEAKAKAKLLEAELVALAAPGLVHEQYTFDQGGTLGAGGYGLVKKATHKETGLSTAIKILKLPDLGKPSSNTRGGKKDGAKLGRRASEMFYSGRKGRFAIEADLTNDDIINEIKILLELDHPSILKMYEFYISVYGDKVYLVTELLDGGELLDTVIARGSYTERDARAIFKSVCEGLHYLHSADKQIVHRDLKLENLLLANPNDLSSVRIVDFGLAKSLKLNNIHSGEVDEAYVIGTPPYIAPETIRSRVYTTAVDMWAAGVCLYILLSGVVPFGVANTTKVFNRVTRGAYSLDGPEFNSVNADAKNLIRGLMCSRPDKRLTAPKALKHPWMVATNAELGTNQLNAAAGKLKDYASKMKLPVQKFWPGEFLIRQGDPATEVFYIRTGECEVLLEEVNQEDSSAPKTYVKLATVQAGEFVGERGVAESGDTPGAEARKRNASVRAVTAVTAMAIKPGQLQWIIERDPQAQEEFAKVLEDRRKERAKTEKSLSDKAHMKEVSESAGLVKPKKSKKDKRGGIDELGVSNGASASENEISSAPSSPA